MLVLIAIENGVKKIIPLTADAGAGNPVGTLIHTYKKSNPSGYLYCDGSTFDQTKYPLLYAYLGSNVLPDYREVVEVGAEQNTTDTIATHDVYTEGQFKDDQLQDHAHSNTWTRNEGIAIDNNVGSAYNLNDSNTTKTATNARVGTTTHGKQKAVFVYIKATSGLSENAQDNVINTLNEQRSYSTTEQLTGEKWISGQPIYRKTIDCGYLPNAGNKTVAHNISGFDQAIKVFGVATSASGNNFPLPYVTLANELNISLFVDKTNIELSTGIDRSAFYCYVTIEYTKTV
jgi:microcystin-dependent protein